MDLLGWFLQLILFGLVLAATHVAQAIAQVLPGCPNSCGNLSIPYPFGTQPGCYLNEDFLITCNETHFSPPKPFLRKGNIQVTNISFQGQLNVLQRIAYDCYAQNRTRVRRNIPSLTLSKFAFSATENKFMAVGCDTYALVQGFQGAQKYSTGCLSICGNISFVDDSCTGNGCCQISIPKGLRGTRVRLSSFNNHSDVWDFNPCSYAFVVEDKEFKFSANSLAELPNIQRLPVVIDWAIGNETCNVARNNVTGYACKGNSTCVDSDNGPGYRCDCLPGYEGNAYFDDCQDINECDNPDLNDCEKPEYCHNKVGNYTCSCPKGYHGDGRNDGNGCSKNQLQIIEVALGTGIVRRRRCR